LPRPGGAANRRRRPSKPRSTPGPRNRSRPCFTGGQRGTEIVSSWGTVGKDRLDDYLAAIIKHSGRAGGSAGETFSLTADKSVALRFIRHKNQGKVLAIATKNDPENFRTIENILKYEGPRLVKEKKITSGTLASAIRYALEENEKEIFYLGGSIPSNWIEVAV